MSQPVEVEPRLKATIDCPCGCGAHGFPRQKRNRDRTYHTRNCECRSCAAGQHVKDEKTRVGKFARASGLHQNTASGRHVGFDLSGVLAVEETSEATLVRHLKLWWATEGVQRKLKRVRAQNRVPWCFLASWDGKTQLAVLPASHLAALALAASGSDMEMALQLVDRLVEVTFPPCETTGDDE